MGGTLRGVMFMAMKTTCVFKNKVTHRKGPAAKDIELVQLTAQKALG